MRRFGVLLVGLALSGCQPRDPQLPRPDPAAQAACAARGGTYGRGGLSPDFLCFVPTPDAGKSCSGALDCTGACLAGSRTCSKITPKFGCYGVLDGQGQALEICVD
ncbi:hypothetical protein ACSSNL_02770 [Thalassobius sp. S69A]|uniref:hypothetical protein n=1 Tax=unclassified Thalassovita TaxID=2619711 RepID=UPI000C4DCAB8|nr:hypothetical protein [Paracoccaceae bacterium]